MWKIKIIKWKLYDKKEFITNLFLIDVKIPEKYLIFINFRSAIFK